MPAFILHAGGLWEMNQNPVGESGMLYPLSYRVSLLSMFKYFPRSMLILSFQVLSLRHDHPTHPYTLM